jgi:NADH dehydrogenase
LVRDLRAAGKHISKDVELAQGDVTKADSLRGAMDGCDAVIHLVAIIEESGGATFRRGHPGRYRERGR